MSKNIKTRIQNKHDLEVNWLLAENFVPLQGELIVYDIEVDADGAVLTKTVDGATVPALPEGRTEPYCYERIKIGDGVHAVNDLPFIADLSEHALKSEIPVKLSQLENDSKYITLEEVPETDLSNYAKKSDIPDVSKFITDIPDEYVTDSELTAKGYLTEHQSLAGLATESYVTDKIAEAKQENTETLKSYATKDDIKNFITEIPVEYVTESELEGKGYLTDHQDISHLATKDSIPTKVSQLENDKAYLTTIPAEYITESELEAKGYLTQHQDLGDYAKKTDIPDVSEFIKEIPEEYVTDSELTAKGYITTHQDISHLATIASVPTKVSQLENDSKYLTEIPAEYITEAELTSKDYATTQQLVGLATESYVDGKANLKVDKEDGKGLSTNDFTTAEKNKLAGVAEGANKTIIDSTLSSTSENPVHNKVITAELAKKADSSSLEAAEARLNEKIENIDLSGFETKAESTTKDAVVLAEAQRYADTEIASKLAEGLAGKSDTGHTHDYIPTTVKGAANGIAELDENGKVPSAQLPSYVDDVIEKENKAAFPATGESGKIYVALDDNKTYRWSGSAYVEISSSIALGETSATAYRGDRGKTAYDHSQVTSGNPHNVTKTDVGLSNVENKSSETIRSELTSSNVTTALGYTPATKNVATTSTDGLMSAADKAQLGNLGTLVGTKEVSEQISEAINNMDLSAFETKSESTTKDAVVLAEAQLYTDTALANAKSYTDTKVNELITCGTDDPSASTSSKFYFKYTTE
jgi:hypothetical protein